MGIFEVFGKMPVAAKTAAFGIGSLMPCFFVAIYLLMPSWIKNITGNPLLDMDLYFLLSMCFLLSAIWFVLWISLSQTIAQIDEFKTGEKTDEGQVIFDGVGLSILFLAVAVFVNIGFTIPVKFKSFIAIIFLAIGSWLYASYRDVEEFKKKAKGNKEDANAKEPKNVVSTIDDK